MRHLLAACWFVAVALAAAASLGRNGERFELPPAMLCVTCLLAYDHALAAYPNRRKP